MGIFPVYELLIRLVMRFNEIINSIVADYVNALNHNDVKKIMGIFSDNAELNSPLLAGARMGDNN